MFVTKQQAEARLKEDRNIFREGAALPGGSNETQHPEVIIEYPDAGEEGEAGNEGRDEGRDEHDSSSISLSHLDHLLFPKLKQNSRPYMGRLESQVAIAETELIAGPTIAARTFGLSTSQVDAYSNGYRSNGEQHGSPSFPAAPPKPELLQRINKTKEALAVKAASRLDMTLNALTPVKISQIKKATNLSRVAKDMSVIMDKCTPKDDVDKGAVHFHVWRPEIKNENHYTTVNVGPSIPAPFEQPK